MFSISGYRVGEQVHESEQSLIFRARRESDGVSVILKVLKDVHPPPERIARFKREYQLVKSLDVPGVVRAYDFSYTADHWVFVQEDFGGESIARLGLAGRIELGEFMGLAETIAGHVASIHRQGVTHKDLNPANIAFNPQSGAIKLIDFGIAIRLSRETVAFDHPSLLEGTPTYVSPEQTGRMNQPLDHRTDLYSLGCTFYELLTGAPPFEAKEVVELLHCHLARTPEPIGKRRADVPAAVASIIDKLLAKNASDRYQTARGLQADLELCRRAWAAGATLADFVAGKQDVAERLAPPGKLYGRESELAELSAAFDRVAGGAGELLLVSGHAGIGKSALIKELYRPVTRQHGFFISGKFDQLQRDTPYGPLLGALDGLLGQILMEPQEKTSAWARALQANVGNLLPALVEVLPRVGLLYERIAPAPVLSATELKFRFIRALATILRVSATAEHPLVLFIDDLQWADSASMDFLTHVVTAEPVPHLLILGAYRHEEVPAGHRLPAALKEIRAAGAVVSEIHLGPLDVDDTAELLADTLHRPVSEVREAAAIVHEKTGGNPFFVQIFLDALVAEQVLHFDHLAGRWSWRLDGLRLLDSSDNVVDLLIANLQKLPDNTRELLSVASCIGNQFDLGLLSAVVGRPAEEVAASLMPAMTENYLLPTTSDYRLLEAGIDGLPARLDVSYKVAHDRIQQAAYGLNAPGTHAAIHLRIGRGMRTHWHGKSADDRLLATVNQLNQATHLVEDPSERRQIAALNLEAGKKAKAAVAHTAALEYFEAGLTFLGGEAGVISHRSEEGTKVPSSILDHAFGQAYSLALALNEEAAEVAYLAANFTGADRHVEAILRHARRPFDRVNAVQTRVKALLAQNQLLGSIVAAREIYEPLGIDLPANPTEEDLATQFEAVTRELAGRPPRVLADLPNMTATEPAAAMRLLYSLFMSAFLAQPNLAPLVATQMVLLSMRHGLSEESGPGFIFYAMALCGRGQVVLGYEFGQVAEILVERHQRKAQMPDLAVLGGFYVFHWQRPVRESIEKMRNGYWAGVESGYISSAANCLQCSSAMGYLSGRELADIDAEYAESARVLEQHKAGPFLTWLRQYRQAVQNFRGLNDDPTQLRGEVYDEIAELPVHETYGDLTAIYMIHFNKAILGYHFHDYELSLRSTKALEYGNQPGAVVYPIVVMYRCLALLATAGDVPEDARAALLEEASTLVARMKGWGESCPVNYAHKYHLMAAEFCRVSGQIQEAREHYDLAVDLARKHEYTHEEGLALERAALFYLEQKNGRLAGYYLRDAHYVYGRWGASAKRDFLRRRYGYLLERETGPRNRIVTTTKKTTTSELGELDLGTVLAATRAIAKETDVRQLLHTVMRVSLENAGAERGCLILVRNDNLIVKVRGELGEEKRFDWLSLSLGDYDGLARSVVQYVARTSEPVVLENAAASGMFTTDPHIKATACKSVLCVPILNQGALVAITYLENNQAASVFNEDRLDVLTLLMGQAAISIENAMLKASNEAREFHFRVGGSLPADSPAYVRRKADELLLQSVQRGEFCFVFNTRQMGKSSLRVRTLERLVKAGAAGVSIDITSIGAQGVTIEQWYAGFARNLINGLGLQKDFDLRRWWRDRSDLSAVQRLEVLVDEVLLARIDKNIAVFIDEIDAVLGLGLPLDDFFALIRHFYNRRADDPRYQRLCFVLLGVAAPTDLIQDKRRTPFNIGQAIPLSAFRFDEAKSLLPGFAGMGDSVEILKAVLHWSGGQPFLTQKLCRLVSESESRPLLGKEREWVGGIVKERVIDKWRHHDDPEHLKTIEARILHGSENPAALLQGYGQILEQGEVDAGRLPFESTLLLSGLVTQTFDKLHVGNPIYSAVFGREWIEQCLAGKQ